MTKTGHAAKGSNAMVATVDFYSTALADALRENEELRAQVATLADGARKLDEAVKLHAPVIRSVLVWEGAEEGTIGAYERRLREDVAKLREAMDDRSSMKGMT